MIDEIHQVDDQAEVPEAPEPRDPATHQAEADARATLVAAHVRPELYDGIVRRVLGGEVLFEVLTDLQTLSGTDIYTQEARIRRA